MNWFNFRQFVFVLASAAFLLPKPALATELGIAPVLQQTPQWCWAASSEMVLSYYGFPNLNPGGNYQCGVVAAQGGPCMAYCGNCLNGGGSTPRIAAVIQSYAMLTAQMTGYQNQAFRPRAVGVLSAYEIMYSIDDGAPIIAGISPNGIPFPPNSGFSQHAVVIIGYEGDASNLMLILNDPYPYPAYAVPYVSAGGRALQYGQYEISYDTFYRYFHYGTSIVFD